MASFSRFAASQALTVTPPRPTTPSVAPIGKVTVIDETPSAEGARSSAALCPVGRSMKSVTGHCSPRSSHTWMPANRSPVSNNSRSAARTSRPSRIVSTGSRVICWATNAQPASISSPTVMSAGARRFGASR